MKYFITFIFATSLSFGGFFKESDKQLHVGLTAVVGVVGHGLALKHGATRTQAFWIGVGSALVVGLAKEVYDSRDGGTGFDGRDMIANGIGGVLGSGSGLILYKF